METVALISGGKDSTFNAMHCVANGYRLVALANLKPPAGKDELDSYMYQTVGHDLLEAYSACYGLPLYQRVIQGNPIVQSYEYVPSADDEVEDLYELLLEVKQHHPALKFVSVGAILSNYQRIRVENVCARLELIPLAWLWRQPQTKLLESMIQNGIQAIIVKVAAMGLSMDDLGKGLPEISSKMQQIAGKCGLNPCGEGGEYESITLDCPLFKKRIIIEESERVILKDCEIAPVAYLSIKKFRLEDKLTLEKFKLDWELLPATNYYCGVENESTFDDHFDLLNLDAFTFTNDLSPLQTAFFAFVCIIYKELPDEFTLFAGANAPSKIILQMQSAFLNNAQYKFAFLAIASLVESRFANIQSISYWAPSSLGRFSQFVQLDKKQVILSGISGLVPRTLKVATEFSEQFNLAVSHLGSILESIQYSFSSVSHLNVFLTDAMEIILIKRATHKLFPSVSIMYFLVDRLQGNAKIELQASINFKSNILSWTFD